MGLFSFAAQWVFRVSSPLWKRAAHASFIKNCPFATSFRVCNILEKMLHGPVIFILPYMDSVVNTFFEVLKFYSMKICIATRKKDGVARKRAASPAGARFIASYWRLRHLYGTGAGGRDRGRGVPRPYGGDLGVGVADVPVPSSPVGAQHAAPSAPSVPCYAGTTNNAAAYFMIQ
jgi:hypothetical protein